MFNKPALFAATLMTVSAAAMADDRIPDNVVPPAAVIHQLVADGYDVRQVEFERGRYDVRVRTTDGKLLKLAADPATGKLYSPSAATNRGAKDAGPAMATNAADAISLAAAEGHYLVSELNFRDGLYRIDARDDAGIPALIEVNASNGQISQVKHFDNR